MQPPTKGASERSNLASRIAACTTAPVRAKPVVPASRPSRSQDLRPWEGTVAGLSVGRYEGLIVTGALRPTTAGRAA